MNAIATNHHRRIIARAIAAGVLAPLVAIAVLLATASSADAATRASAQWVPHIDRTIVPIRSESFGRQVATWYGPGFFGHRTACGQTLTQRTWGIAHRTLPCGTLVTLVHHGRRVTVPVIDRGPYSGATVDLTARTKTYLRFVSGTVRMVRVKKFRMLPRGVRHVWVADRPAAAPSASVA